MAVRYPYVASPGPILRNVEQLRKSFPKELTAETLRKLGIAPKNESYVINVLRFLGVIDSEGNKVGGKSDVFLQHKDDDFAKAVEKLVRDSYEELFELHEDVAWTLDRGSLVQFFRTTDHSTEVVGTRQATTFQTLAALAGHGERPPTAEPAVQRKRDKEKGKKSKGGTTPAKVSEPPPVFQRTVNGGRDVGLTVRIEVNLPADGDQETYDRIFQSIRKNLIDAE